MQNDNQVELDEILNQTLDKKSYLSLTMQGKKRSSSAKDYNENMAYNSKQLLIDKIDTLQQQVVTLQIENKKLKDQIDALTKPMTLNQ